MTLWGYLHHAAISRCGGPAAGVRSVHRDRDAATSVQVR